jgi:hypothetical protein
MLSSSLDRKTILMKKAIANIDRIKNLVASNETSSKFALQNSCELRPF